MENTGDDDYDALNLSLEKRYANNWSGRVSYSLSKVDAARPTIRPTRTRTSSADRSQPRRCSTGPASVDRRHILSLSGRDRDSEDRRRHAVEPRSAT